MYHICIINVSLFSYIYIYIYIYKYAAFCFYIYGPLQVVSYDPWHCFDAVKIRSAQFMKIVSVPSASPLHCQGRAYKNNNFKYLFSIA